MSMLGVVVHRGRLSMTSLDLSHSLPLPRGWPRRVRSAVVQVIPLPTSDRFVASATAEIATRPERPSPGWDSHLLDQRAFYPRRIWTTSTCRRSNR